VGLGADANHVHLVLVPPDPDALRRCLAPTHRRYAGHVHAREGRSGHFWQGRFGCVAMDEAHLVAAVRYIALNPVRAGLAARAADWRWSSVHAHLQPERGDGLTTCEPVRSRFADFAEALACGEDEAASARLRRAETIGRPLGAAQFIAALEARSGRPLAPAKRGRKPGLSALSP
jgi:putative transposase